MSADQAERPSVRVAQKLALDKCNYYDVAKLIAQETGCDEMAAKFDTLSAQLEEARGLLERIRQIASGEIQVANDDTEGMAVIAREIQKFLSRKGGA